VNQADHSTERPN